MAIISAVGAIASGVMGMMQANYQAQVAKMNAEIAENNAIRAAQRGGIEAQEKDVETAALLGEQQVAQAASGVTLSGKSQILTRNTARMLGARDRSTIIENAGMERYNHLVQKANFNAEKDAARMSGIASLVGGFLGAAGSVAGSLPGSMIGGATSTAVKPIPIPKPKPTIAPSLAPPPVKSFKVAPVKNFATPRTLNPLTRKRGLLGPI